MAAALIAQLLACRPALQLLGDLEAYEEERDSPTLVVRVDAGRLSRQQCDATLRSVCEALSTLTLLARVDATAWHKEVEAVWPQFDLEPVADLLHRRNRDTSITMGVRFEVDNAVSLEPIMTRMLQNGFSPKFRELLMSLEDDPTVSSQHVRSRRWPHPTVPIYLSLVCQCTESQLRQYQYEKEQCVKAERVFNKIMQLVSSQRQNDEMVFTIDTVDVGTLKYAVKPATVGLIGQLVELGVRVQGFPLIRSRSTSANGADKEKQALASGLRSLFGVPGALPSCCQLGLREVTILDARHAHFAEVFTAVQHSKSLEYVVLEGLSGPRDIDDDEYWKWVAFGLFSSFSTHNIKTIELRLPSLRMSDVTAVHDILTVRNPFPALYAKGDPTQNPRRLRASEFRIRDSVLEEGISLSTESPIDVLLADETVDSDGFLHVLLPGGGFVGVTPNHESVPTDSDQGGQDRSARTFETVIVRGMAREVTSAIIALFRFIGRGIKRLEIHDTVHTKTDRDDWIRQLFNECPELVELTIDSSDIRRLAPFYLSSTCRLQRLKINTVKHIDDEHELFMLFFTLCDPAQQLTRHMCDLDLDLGVHYDWDVFAALQRLMTTNRHLRSLRIHAHVKARYASQYQSELGVLFPSGSNGQASTSTRVHKLRSESKRAFLCAVHRASRAGSGTAIGLMDASVTASIFEFAGDRCIQSMQLTVT